MNEEMNTYTAEEEGVCVERTIEVITAEIWLYKNQAGAAILEIGRRLNEAKAQLSHGEWLSWLSEKVEFSEVTAQRFMRLAREYENPSLVTDLGASKALVLLALPDSERSDFIAEKHEVSGEEKSVFEMTKRELEQTIRERDAATEKTEKVIRTLTEKEQTEQELRRALKKASEEAEEAAHAAEKEMDALRDQLKEISNRPTIVEIQKVADEDAVAAAAEKARKDTEKKLTAAIEKAESAKAEAEKAKAKAEQDLAALKVSQEETAQIAQREKTAMEERVSELQKKLAVAASQEIVIFQLHFQQGQESVNRMNDCIRQMEENGNTEGAGKLKNALKAMLQASLDAIQ